MRITVLLRTELVRYLEKKYIARSFHMEFFMWNVREGSKILYVKLMWSELDMKTEFVYLLFQNDFFFKVYKKNPHQQIVYQYWIKHGVVLIVFPAGILQPPYYHKDYPRSAPWIKYRGESKLKFLVACF